MPKVNNKILKISKLKKDGSIDSTITREITQFLKAGAPVIVPIDAIYGIISTDKHVIKKITEQFPHCRKNNIELLVSSFKMVDHLVQLDKLEYDFLHRIWPGEITVLLDSVGMRKELIPMRIPKSRYILDIIDQLEKEIFHISLYHINNDHIYKKDHIINYYGEFADKIIIINEFCKEHTIPSVIDIRNDTLEILEDGRVSSEEIKSLYFL